MSIGFRNSVARWYFYITPLFILLDYIWGVNVRVSALDSMPVYKNVYYGFCVLCGISMYAVPRYTAVVALFESVINFTMIMLCLFVPYVQNILFVDDILDADFKTMGETLNSLPIVNLLIVGSCAVMIFRRSIETIKEALGLSRPNPEQ
jgi:hypothetical protein